MPFLGAFNRRVTLETKIVTQDATGHPVEAWAVARTMWANRRDVTANERFRSNQELATRSSVFTLRWFRELNAGDWRINHESALWDIEGIAEPRNTRRQWWEITASAVMTGAAIEDTEAPTAPQGLVATAISGSAIDLTWTASTDNVAVTGYNIYRDAVLIDSGIVSTSYGDVGLTEGLTYSYRVSARDAAGNESALSLPDTATTGYSANTVNFDGTNDYLVRGTGLTGAVDSKLWTGSLWARRTSSGTTQRIIASTGLSAAVYFGSDNKFSVVGENSAGSIILLLSSVMTITDTNWHHFAWSVDLTDNGLSRLYVDDVSSASSTTTNATIDFTVANWAIGAQVDGTQKLAGDLAEVQTWFGKWLDLDIEGNRRLFITALGGRVDPATAAASPLGTPIILQAGPTSTWHVNDGGGGGMTLNGLLTDGTPF